MVYEMNNTIYEYNQGMPQSLQYSTNFVWQGKFITKPGKPPIHPQTGRYFNPSKEWINITSDVERLFEIICNGHPVCCQLGTKEDNA